MKNKITLLGLFTAFLIVTSWIKIPTPFGIPFTLQVFGVILTIYFLKKDAWKAVLIYILLGAIGLPVFAGFGGGISVIFGPTGGYIIGFLLATLVAYLPFENIINGFLAIAIIYIFGITGLIFKLDISLIKAINIGFLPFILFDSLKVILGYYTYKLTQKYEIGIIK
ncbi:biotin transport system substrate-specific component [Marinitoga hydrogenitolerans DSM 16785]|uniref:Biotin transporter n=1 Tax=Marinitoga hydrogenitolerans (strain DSM 16785 / JCM 12826 / AT1271) TaxID=1122195 RepID=A0A1M4YDE1_MARH1|nr:biotin transporter BioY [Marinitoga hydrogenitolerans]SHF03770.1 biotin transport system substrate-specific component [Marinitoga hydrogenitolerans DSM 16785]